MTIKVGDRLPAGSLNEYIEVESAECKIGPNEFKVDDLTRGKKVVLFGLPGAFTPTCSAKHVPGYVANYDKLKAKGVSDIVCMSVNDAFVMGAWAKDQKAGGKVRMMGDGSAAYTKALGPRVGPGRTRHGRALPAFLGAHRRRRREDAQYRRPRQIRSVRCGHDAQAARLKFALDEKRRLVAPFFWSAESVLRFRANGSTYPYGDGPLRSRPRIPSSCSRLE